MATLTCGPGAGEIDATRVPLTGLLSGTYACSPVDGSLLPFDSFITGIRNVVDITDGFFLLQ